MDFISGYQVIMNVGYKHNSVSRKLPVCRFVPHATAALYPVVGTTLGGNGHGNLGMPDILSGNLEVFRQN